MPKSEDYTPVDVNDIGLDRSRINDHQQIEVPLRNEDAIPSQGRDDQIGPNHDRKRNKIKKALHIKKDSVLDHSHDPPKDNKESALLAVPDDEPVEGGVKATVKKVAHELDKETMKGLIHDPIGTVNEKVKAQGGKQVAANIASKEIPLEQDEELLEAQDAVKNARSDPERKLATENLERLLKERQTRFVRWTLDRHITKVRVLPRDLTFKKPMSEFQHKNALGQVVTDWKAYAHHLFMYYVQQYGGQYIGAGTGVPPPSKQNIIPNIERLLVASAPFQQMAMTIRRVYRWQNPSETAKYLVIYIILWWFDVIICGVLSAIVYFVIERRVRGFHIEDLREDIKRSKNAQATAMTINEFIDKRGDENWAEDVIQTVGTWLMM